MAQSPIAITFSPELSAVLAADAALHGYATPFDLVLDALSEWRLHHEPGPVPAHSSWLPSDRERETPQSKGFPDAEANAVEAHLLGALESPLIAIDLDALRNADLGDYLQTELGKLEIQ